MTCQSCQSNRTYRCKNRTVDVVERINLSFPHSARSNCVGQMLEFYTEATIREHSMHREEIYIFQLLSLLSSSSFFSHPIIFHRASQTPALYACNAVVRSSIRLSCVSHKYPGINIYRPVSWPSSAPWSLKFKIPKDLAGVFMEILVAGSSQELTFFFLKQPATIPFSPCCLLL